MTEKELQNICDCINEKLQSSRSLELKEEDIFNQPCDIYWDRSVYIANKFDSDECRQDVLINPREYVCMLSDDMDEHPGIVFRFKDEEKDIW